MKNLLGQMNNTLQRATITLQHSDTAPLEQVFSEFADPQKANG